MSNVVNISPPPEDKVPPVYAETLEAETIEWVAAVRIIEAALIEFSGRLPRDDGIALARAWSRIQRG